MDADDLLLAEQLKAQLADQGLPVALPTEPAETPSDEPDALPENPLETDFFRAINAFRAARASGDAAAVAAAEERLRGVVRSELTGEPCEPSA